MRDLVAGERAGLSDAISIGVDEAIPLALIALDGMRATSSAFPPIDATSREMRPAAHFVENGRLELRLDLLSTNVDRLLLVAYDTGSRALRRRITTSAGELRFTVDLSGREDAAVILVEIYRHRGEWRLAANGQGFSSGLVAVAAAHGADLAWARRLGGTETQPTGRPAPRVGAISSGSGVAVDRNHVLSNAHVVEDGGPISLLVGGRALPADLVFTDQRNDLALLRVDAVLPSVALFRSKLDLHLGEDVMVLGFPLQGLLGSGPQASTGNIAALCGMGNDSTVFQFTAPIASGNSGGPILDTAGRLIGLVSSSLNLDRIRDAGANAQNINFAIKGAVIRSFLDAFGLEPQTSDKDDPLGGAAIARQMRDAIFRITCAC